MDGRPVLKLKRWYMFRIWWMVSVAGIVGIVGLAMASQLRKGGNRSTTGFRVVAEFPHDAQAFTQGLAVVSGQMYEGTGKKGESSLRKVQLNTGRVETIVPLDSTYFGEGITAMNGKIYQITWQNRVGIVYDQKTLKRIGTFGYTGEGWGLTNDGKRLILSDGTSTLRFLDPNTFEVVNRIKVRSSSGLVDNLNELEYMKGEILANIWYSDRIARISPATGEVLGWIDLTSLYPAKRRGKEEVLNGIAYDEEAGRLFVTGKNWPKLYEIELLPKK